MIRNFCRLMLLAITCAVFTTAPSVVAANESCTIQNPTVSAGLLHWHKSFKDACAAAQRSGKPVILFQMLGRLDQEFC
jgi:hypothetical protein